MATYLVFNGNSHTKANPINLGSDFEFEVKIDALTDVTSEQWIISQFRDSNSDRAFALRIKSGELQTYFSNNGGSTDTGPTISISTGVPYVINTGKLGSSAFISVNGGAQSTASIFSGDVFQPTYDIVFGAKYSASVINELTGRIEYIKLSKSSVLTNHWDSSASNTSNTGQQPVWTDVVGSNDANGEGFPTDGTAWDDTGVGTPDALNINNSSYEFKKNNNGTSLHTITGSYTGSPTNIEYSIDGGAWQVGVASPTGGLFSFDVSIPLGESVVDIRFSNDTGISSSVILVTPALIVVAAGQSNMSGRGINSQVYTQAGGVKAYLLGNDDNYKLLQDPYDSNSNQVDSVSSDSIAGGSWIVRFAHYWIQNKGTPIAIIPCAKGGSRISQWQDGQSLYNSMVRRVNLVGGADVVFWQQGESDAENAWATTITEYETGFGNLANNINADLGVKTFVIPLHTMTANGFDGNGTTTGQIAIRQAQINVANSNANVSIGQPLTDIDISDNDGLHFWRDDELDLIGSRMYDSFTGEVSNLTITATGIPDGIYNTVLVNSSNEIVHAGNVTYSSGQALLENLALTSGTPLTGFVVDNEISHSNGAVITGTTV